MSQKDRVDRLLQHLTFGVALVRVLRGDKPSDVAADVDAINSKAAELKASIDAHMGKDDPRG